MEQDQDNKNVHVETIFIENAVYNLLHANPCLNRAEGGFQFFCLTAYPTLLYLGVFNPQEPGTDNTAMLFILLLTTIGFGLGYLREKLHEPETPSPRP